MLCAIDMHMIDSAWKVQVDLGALEARRFHSKNLIKKPPDIQDIHKRR